MGWSSGGEIAGRVWEMFGGYVPAEKKPELLREFVDLFQRHDCDTLTEGDDELAVAARSMYAERNGAPVTACIGETFACRWDLEYVFDGTWWIMVDE